jgi:hypothetical protein
MFNKIKELLFGKTAQSVAETPYKVETPAVIEGSANRVEAPAPTVVEPTPVAKAPAKKQQFEKKVATPKVPPKPRAPRKPAVK